MVDDEELFTGEPEHYGKYPKPRLLKAEYKLETIHDTSAFGGSPRIRKFNEFMYKHFSFWYKPWVKRIRKKIGLYDIEDELADKLAEEIDKEIIRQIQSLDSSTGLEQSPTKR